MNHKSNPPDQYQRGWCEFYKLKFHLTEDVLIPRPESELLVDEVLALTKSSKHPEELNRGPLEEGQGSNKPPTIIDIGTGSGCIAIAIVKNLPEVKVIATDISKKALEVAKANAKFHKVANKIIFLEGDLLKALDYYQYDKLVYHTDSNPDIIVTNLPYIPADRIPYLDPSVKDFEPRVALDGGPDGFELYRKLFQQISQQPQRLQPKFMICEIDYTHGELAVQEFLKFFPKAEVEVKKDLAKKIRILIIRFPEG